MTQSMDIPVNWTFKSDEVAAGFDRHVREQLPWYELMSGATAHFARHYIPEGGVVYDLGCSTGNIGNLLADTLAIRNVDFRPVDNAPEMAERYAGPGKVIIDDIATMAIEPFDVAIAFLSLMFVPPGKRAPVFAKLRENIRPGGAIIIVDKTEAVPGYVGTAMARLTLAGKMAGGVPASEILAKELSLIGVQRPLALYEIGSAVEVFRFGEFAGWVIEP